MRSGEKWSTIVDYFLILSAIMGVGFASGKEICVFFFDFGKYSVLGLLAFGLLYIYLFLMVDYIKNKLKVKTYDAFNERVMGKFCKVSNILLIVNFLILCAGMLSGADYLFITRGANRLPSIVLCILTFITLLSGIKGVRVCANIIIPVLLAVIVLNFVGNLKPNNVSLPEVKTSWVIAVFYGLLYGVNNFLPLLPTLFLCDFKKKGRVFTAVSITAIMLLCVLMFASNTFSTSMPMFELSKNISNKFYIVYFVALVMALFSTLMICSYNAYALICNNRKSVFVAGIVVMAIFSLSNFGYEFVIKYLYVVSAVASGVYVLILTIFVGFYLIRNISLVDAIEIKKSFKNYKINIKNIYKYGK